MFRMWAFFTHKPSLPMISNIMINALSFKIKIKRNRNLFSKYNFEKHSLILETYSKEEKNEDILNER